MAARVSLWTSAAHCSGICLLSKVRYFKRAAVTTVLILMRVELWALSVAVKHLLDVYTCVLKRSYPVLRKSVYGCVYNNF